MALSPEDRAAIVQDVLAAIQQMGDAPPGTDDLPPGEDDAPGDDDNPEVHVHVHDGDEDDDPEQYDAAASATDEIPDGMAMDRYGRMYQIAPATEPAPKPRKAAPAPAPKPRKAAPATRPAPAGVSLVRHSQTAANGTSQAGDTQVQLIRLQRQVSNLERENRELKTGVQAQQRESRKLARYARLQALEDGGIDINAQEWLEKLVDLPDAEFEDRITMLERFERRPSKDVIPVGRGSADTSDADETEELERFKRQKRQEGVILKGSDLIRAYREHKGLARA